MLTKNWMENETVEELEKLHKRATDILDRVKTLNVFSDNTITAKGLLADWLESPGTESKRDIIAACNWLEKIAEHRGL